MVTMGLPLRARAPLFNTLGQPLHGIGHWIAGLRRSHIGNGVVLLHPTVELAAPPTACRHGSRVLSSVRNRSARPLRVLCQPQQDTDRLALAGRMADVCAELDRLVEQQSKPV
ncbi:MAG: hypothetical protein JSS31_13375 [Proteobacteria bacterium]|nr:hypothetical protein [Pseudomonadota bacterium]MBS0494914.1 hypothetical protein [Pseudomonadota bacterium]